MCGTVAVGTAKKEGAGEMLLERIVATIYDKCRSDPSCGLIPSFPDFAPLLAEINTSNTETRAEPEYQVTFPHASGSLVVKECFFSQFGEGDNELAEFWNVINDHNERFNKEGVRLTVEPAVNESREQQSQVSQTVAVVEADTALNAEYLAQLTLSQPQVRSAQPQKMAVWKA